MATVEKDCIVHDRKYLSKFHGTINQLRRTDEFNPIILQQLPKRCCSCDGQKGKSLFTIDHLRKICRQIQSSQKQQLIPSNPVKPNPYHYVTLEYLSTLTFPQRTYKIGRFVGRRGRHLTLLESKLNIHIYILNSKSSKHLRHIADGLQIETRQNSHNELQVLFTMKNNNTDHKTIEQTKQSLQIDWNRIDVSIKERRPKVHSYGVIIPPSTDISGDTRWKPKKRRRIVKNERKQKESIEKEEVPPQPLTKPISTSKQTKSQRSQKNKRQ